jgi:hypothetical protein
MEGRAATPVNPQASNRLEELRSLPEHQVTQETREQMIDRVFKDSERPYVQARDKIEPLTQSQFEDKSWLKPEMGRRKVAKHELGHKVCTDGSSRWVSESTTVKPGDGYAGMHKSSPTGSWDDPRTKREMIMIAHGGWVAYDVMGESHPEQGAGSDIGKADAIAMDVAYNELVEDGHPFDESDIRRAQSRILSEEIAEARATVSANASYIESYSYRLAIAETI